MAGRPIGPSLSHVSRRERRAGRRSAPSRLPSPSSGRSCCGRPRSSSSRTLSKPASH